MFEYMNKYTYKNLQFTCKFTNSTELKTLECDILNPDLLINLEIKFMRTTSNI